MTTYTATHTAPGHHRPPAQAFARLVGLQARMAWREPLMPLISLAVPILFLVVVGVVPAFKDTPGPAEFTGDARLSISAYLMPLFICMAVSMIALFCLPQPFVRDRENRWLRRISTTPAPPSWLLGAQTVASTALALLAVTVLTIGGVVVLGVPTPAHLGGYVLAALLLITALFAVGLLITAIAPTAGVAEGVGWALYMPLLVFGGIFVSRANMGVVLRTISDYTPLMAASQAMRDAVLGTFPAASTLLVLAGWTAVCGVAAVRFFRWE
jgi:ABC-2 type transport system permease protein